MKESYMDFLKSKMVIAPKTGVPINKEEVSSILKPHQRDAVYWAVTGGRRALFESFGLGKTVQTLEWCRLIHKHKGGKMLIVCPLGVKQEFSHDAVELLHMDAPKYSKTMEDIENSDGWLFITNYERVRDGNIDPHGFSGTALDEAAVLRSFGSKTYQTFLQKFRGVPFKLVSTATPAPNKYKELIHYAGYLEIMDTGQALTRFFKRDSTKANNLTLYPHKEKEFWLWLSTWALFIQKPSDLGYDDEGYALPKIKINLHKLKKNQEITYEKDGQGKIFQDAAEGLKEAAREKRESIDERVYEAKHIIDSAPNEHFIIWHDLEAERHAIKKAIPEAVEIYGSQDLDTREKDTIDFSEGRIRILATKKELSGSGCNFQKHCHRAIFLGIDYEFNDFIQAVHRIYRFLQTKEVVIDIIFMDTEQAVWQALEKKWQQYDYMTGKMEKIVKKYGLAGVNAAKEMKRSIGVKRMEKKGKNWTAVNNDCIEECKNMQDNSVDEIITSIPFSNHYEYTASYNDFGHNENTERFFEQMDYLSPNLLRILKPGRVFCCHVKDRVLFGNATGKGMPTMEPFHAMCIHHYMKHGFQYFGMITVVTDVVRENNQTYRLGWTEDCKDGTKMGVGCPEYILLFRKLPTDHSKAYADVPVTHSKKEYTRAHWQIDAHGFWRSDGNRPISRDEVMSMNIKNGISKAFKEYSLTHIYNYDEHVEMSEELDRKKKLSSSFMVTPPASWNKDVWDDVCRMKTTNTLQAQKGRQLHVCPLQWDIVDRCIERYSNEGELVFDPFGGLMTVPMRAIHMGRRGYGVELNKNYFKDGVKYLEAEEYKQEMPTLFDLIDAESGVESEKVQP